MQIKPIAIGNTQVDNNVFLAPMAGYTDYPFRSEAVGLGYGLCFTELVSAKGLIYGGSHTAELLYSGDHVKKTGAQIFGSDAFFMRSACESEYLSPFEIVDINMGCPVPKVATRAGAGAFLMRNHKLAGEIIKSCVQSVKIPVSVKTRLGWDETHKDWQDLVKIAADNGAAFITLHGRTRAQGYSGISELPTKPDLPIPIIANGDIKNIADVERVQGMGYDGAMIGRAMLGRPWIIGQICGTCDKPENIGAVVLKHLNLVIDYYGAKAGVPLFRKHAAWYSAGLPNAAQFRVRVNQITDEKELKDIIKDFWSLD